MARSDRLLRRTLAASGLNGRTGITRTFTNEWAPDEGRMYEPGFYVLPETLPGRYYLGKTLEEALANLPAVAKQIHKARKAHRSSST